MDEPSKREKIWQVVNQIPHGRVASYGTIARLAELPGYARYVGHVMKGLPAATKLPWHRVLRANGQIAFPPHSEAWKRQKELLENEGINLLKGRVSMRTYAWPGD